ncbi:MAG: LysR family transcriptional regulator [Pseudomonadota bacterium]
MARRIPSLNWLRVFEAAARAESFSQAAEVLGLSAPAVGQQIKALETHLRTALFVRNPQSVTLTQAGRAYLPAVAQALHGIETTTANLFGEPGRFPLSVRCSLLLATGWLGPRLAGFRADHPDIALRLSTTINDADTSVSGADLRIVFGLPPAPNEDSDPLFGETLVPVAPPDIARQIETPGDLVRWPLIEIATHRANWAWLLPADGPAPQITYADNTLTAFSIAAGGAIALDRQVATGRLAESFGLERCLEDARIPGVQGYTLVYPARTALSRPARIFRNWLLEEVANSQI